MPRRPGYYWDKREQAYRTDAGGKAKYFRGIARDDHAAIAAAFTTHLEALDKARRPPDLDLYDLIAAFLAADRGRKRRRTDVNNKQRLLKSAGFPATEHPDEYGLRPARSFVSADLKSAIRAWQKLGHAPITIAGICLSVRTAFRWAASEDGGRLIPANPFADFKVPSVGRSPDRYAERAEVAAFVRFVDRKMRAIRTEHRRRFAGTLLLLIRVAIYTGARPGILVSAWWPDFDAARRTITLPPDRHKTGHKTGRPLILYLPRFLARDLARERDRPGRHPVAMFTHEMGNWGMDRKVKPAEGEPWGSFITLPDGRPSFDPEPAALIRRVRVLRREAIELATALRAQGKPTRGLELIRDKGHNRFVMYRIRHTKASDDLMAGGNATTVATLLGTSVNMLDKFYAHLQDDHLSRAADELSTSAKTWRSREKAEAPRPADAPPHPPRRRSSGGGGG